MSGIEDKVVVVTGLRQEAGHRLRVKVISPGMTRTNFAEASQADGYRATTHTPDADSAC